MALQALRSAFNRGGDPVATDGSAAPADPMTSGGTDAAMFGCPGCGRTIAKGSTRCGGCGQRLLLDVPARKASMLVGAGLIAGFALGAVLFGLTAPRPQDAAAAATGAAAPSAGPTAIPADVASKSMAALRGTATLNGRLAAQAVPLSKALAAKKLDVPDVVKVLRRMTADTRAAAAMVPSLGTWTDAAAHQAALSAFYEQLSTELNDGLAASVKSGSAYRKAAEHVMALLARLPALDAASRDLASGMGGELPAVEFPAVLTGD